MRTRPKNNPQAPPISEIKWLEGVQPTEVYHWWRDRGGRANQNRLTHLLHTDTPAAVAVVDTDEHNSRVPRGAFLLCLDGPWRDGDLVVAGIPRRCFKRVDVVLRFIWTTDDGRAAMLVPPTTDWMPPGGASDGRRVDVDSLHSLTVVADLLVPGEGGTLAHQYAGYFAMIAQAEAGRL